MILTLAALLAGTALQGAAPARIHSYNGVSLSPKGDLLVTIESQDAMGSAPAAMRDEKAAEGRAPGPGVTPPPQRTGAAHAVVLVRSVADGKTVVSFDPCPTCSYSGATFSPDGASLAFMANEGKTGTATLMTAQVSTPKRFNAVVQVKGVAQTPRWSPDGRMIAMLATPGARKQTGATQAGVPLVGEIGVAGGDDEQRIGLVPAAGGAIRYASPGDTFVYEFDWTPDGQGFVATAAKGNGDNNWWVAKLERFGVDGSERVIASPKFQINHPRVTPDGLGVAVIGGLMSDFGAVGGDLYVAPLAGGDLRNITPGFKGSFTSLQSRPDALYATALIGSDDAVVRVEAKTGAPTTLFKAAVSYSAGDGKVSVSRDGRTIAASAQSFEVAPAIGVWTANGGIRHLTHDNDALPALVTAKNLTWKSDGYDVQGWLIGPKVTEPGKTYPMIMLVHGGPSSASTPGYVSRGGVYELIKAGYYVFEPNPRGSYGQGEQFTRANIRDFGFGDLRDDLAGVDAAIKAAPIDGNRLGVTGGSYGGFMTMWVVTHTDRFKAAAAGAGISNWSSYYGENGIQEWMPPFFGDTFYNDPAIYDKLSPIRYIKNAKTPTFIYVGERDVECPAPQSLEMFTGLQKMGVPTSLVIYEGEGHGIRGAEHVKDLNQRTLAWFDKYLAVK